MSVQFPSIEWAKELIEKVNKQPEFKEKIKLNGSAFVLNIQAEKGLLEEDFNLWLYIDDGEIQEYKALKSLDGVDTQFRLISKYSMWKKMFMGDLGPTMAFIST